MCGEERKIGVRLSAAKHNDKDSFASFRARKGSLWVGSEPKDTVQEEDEEEKSEHIPLPTTSKSIIKVEKIREKFEVMKTSPPSSSIASSITSSSLSHSTDMETEESVSSKLEQWKRRRIERLER